MSRASVEPYRLPSGRYSYKRLYADTLTKLRVCTHDLRLREAELAAIPKPVRVLCRVVGRLLRGREA